MPASRLAREGKPRGMSLYTLLHLGLSPRAKAQVYKTLVRLPVWHPHGSMEEDELYPWHIRLITHRHRHSSWNRTSARAMEPMRLLLEIGKGGSGRQQQYSMDPLQEAQYASKVDFDVINNELTAHAGELAGGKYVVSRGLDRLWISWTCVGFR